MSDRQYIVSKCFSCGRTIVRWLDGYGRGGHSVLHDGSPACEATIEDISALPLGRTIAKKFAQGIEGGAL